MISCKEATLLSLKKEEGKLSIIERLKLRMHLNMCKVCEFFSLQTKFITKHAIEGADHTHSHLHMSDPEKNELKNKFV